MTINYQATSSPIYVGRFAQAALQPTVVAGDSLTDGASDYGSFRWGLPLNRSPLTVIHNAGVGGNTINQLWARWQTDVLDKLPNGGWIILRIGTNSSDTDFEGTYQDIVDTVLADPNLKMIMLALPPRSNDRGAEFIARNNFIAGLTVQNPQRLFFIHDSEELGDVNYDYLSQYYVDQVHMNALGQWTQGEVISAELPAITGAAPDHRVTSNDNINTNPASLQWVANPLNTGAPDDWNLGTFGGTGSSSLVAADGGDPNQTPWFRITVDSFGANGQSVNANTVLLNPAITQPSEAPANLRVTAEVRFNNLKTANLKDFRIWAADATNEMIEDWTFGLDDVGFTDGILLFDFIRPIDSSKTYAANDVTLYLSMHASGADINLGSFDVRAVSVRETS